MIVPVAGQYPLPVAVGVVILPMPQRPEKGHKPKPAEKQRHGDQVDKDFHAGAYLSLSAFSETVTDDSDIAKAAMSGVARPKKAIGTASRL